jgi:hypothetical protein
MKYATAVAFRMALEARIKQGQNDSAGVSRVRKRIVFERLLARAWSPRPPANGCSRAASPSNCASGTSRGPPRTRVYARGRRSRVKDLVDVVVIAETSTIDAAKLAEATTVIFVRRAEHPVPANLPEPPTEWGRGRGRDLYAMSPLLTTSRTATAPPSRSSTRSSTPR